jgi:hypothetical protein
MRRSHTPPADITPAALRELDAAKYIGLTRSFLRAARVGRCVGPDYIRVGRAVLYHRADLDAFLAARRVGGDRG